MRPYKRKNSNLQGRVSYIDEVVTIAFIEAVFAQTFCHNEIDKSVSIVYPPLNGAGLNCVMRALKKNGFTNISVVAEQEKPDGNVPTTCPYPNPEKMFKKNNKHIASLIRYMEYYAPEDEKHYTPVISAFDLLYAEYDKSLEQLAKRLNSKDSKFKSEQIMAAILRAVLLQEKFKILTFHQQVYLKQLVRDKKQPLEQEHIDFSDREESYMRNMASCDFVIYYKTGKRPVAVIEVDGGLHETPKQQERDRVKNSVLQKAGIPLKRIGTTDGEVEDRVEKFLLSCLCAD